MIYVVAKNFVREGCLDEFLPIAKKLVEETKQKDAGCVRYSMVQDLSEPLFVTVLEEWESQEALDNHMKSAHFLDAIPKLGALCSKPGEIALFRKLF
jgi:quinol monooxygenase YgiN